MRLRQRSVMVLAVLSTLVGLASSVAMPTSVAASIGEAPSNSGMGVQLAELSSALDIQATGTTHAAMTYSRSEHRLSGTASTVGWSRGTIRIEGVLRGPDSRVIYSRENTCSNSTFCTLPTWSRRPIQQGTYEWWVRGTGPGGSDTDVAHLGVFW